MIEGCIWKTNSTTYNLQLKFRSNSEFQELDTYLKDWRQIGTGTNKTGDILNIFSRQFLEPKHWNMFAKTLPVVLHEIDRDGNKKPVKTAIVSKKLRKSKKPAKIAKVAKTVKINKVPKQGGRICGKCGNAGHNVRTCKV
jgi:hypothetical protein